MPIIIDGEKYLTIEESQSLTQEHIQQYAE